jgi:hypothetical protein
MTMTERKRRGRPPIPINWEEVEVRELTAEDIAQWEATRNRGGRPANRDLNQWLLEVVNDAKRRGISRRTCLIESLERKHGHAPKMKDVFRCERQIGRLLGPAAPKLRRPAMRRSRPIIKKWVMSEN